MFKEDTFLELPLLPSEASLDTSFYQQIKQSRLHKVTTKPGVFPYVEFISWLIKKSNIKD